MCMGARANIFELALVADTILVMTASIHAAALAVMLGASQAASAASSLSEALAAATFYHTGTARATDGEPARS